MAELGLATQGEPEIRDHDLHREYVFSVVLRDDVEFPADGILARLFALNNLSKLKVNLYGIEAYPAHEPANFDPVSGTFSTHPLPNFTQYYVSVYV